MKIPWPYRFKTYEDGQKFIENGYSDTSLSIPTHIEKDGKISINPDYENAPWEIGVTFFNENRN